MFASPSADNLLNPSRNSRWCFIRSTICCTFDNAWLLDYSCLRVLAWGSTSLPSFYFRVWYLYGMLTFKEIIWLKLFCSRRVGPLWGWRWTSRLSLCRVCKIILKRLVSRVESRFKWFRTAGSYASCLRWGYVNSLIHVRALIQSSCCSSYWASSERLQFLAFNSYTRTPKWVLSGSCCYSCILFLVVTLDLLIQRLSANSSRLLLRSSVIFGNCQLSIGYNFNFRWFSSCLFNLFSCRSWSRPFLSCLFNCRISIFNCRRVLTSRSASFRWHLTWELRCSRSLVLSSWWYSRSYDSRIKFRWSWFCLNCRFRLSLVRRLRS